MRKTVDKLLDDLYSKYIPPSSKLIDTYCIINAPRGIDEIRKLILSLMTENVVITGYMSTGIRGLHDHIIFYKKKYE